MGSFAEYSRFYDPLYHDKDYEIECDFVEKVFRTFSHKPVVSVLDAGCGTGGHAIPMSRRGYKTTGFDLSEDMLAIARKKSVESGVDLTLHLADLRHLDLSEQFDACMVMFAVMGYITSNEDFHRALINIRRHLKKGSLLLFDCWNGLAVLRTLPEVRVKTMLDHDARLIRIAQPKLDALHHICKVNYHLIAINSDGSSNEIQETHKMRFFFPQEIDYHLLSAGFDMVKICPMLDLEGIVDEAVWNIAVIAKAAGEI